MLTALIVLALIVVLVTILVGWLRGRDRNNYFENEIDPFYAEPARLAAAGLLHEEQSDGGRRRRPTYVITPAGEAALRSWLAEPARDPGLLKLYFGGLVAPADVQDVARARQEVHRACLADYERLEELLNDRNDWRYALATVRLGVRFERHALEFWQTVVSEPVDTQATVPEGNGTPQLSGRGRGGNDE